MSSELIARRVDGTERSLPERSDGGLIEKVRKVALIPLEEKNNSLIFIDLQSEGTWKLTRV